MTRVLITGSGGQVGTELVRAAWASGFELCALDLKELDVGDPYAVQRVFREIEPELVINAAAYTAVDRAESEPELAAAANEWGPRWLAEACEARSAALLHLSTDYVFDGRPGPAWAPDAVTAPLGVYGKTKLAGEHAVRERCRRHVIVRTSWVYAAHGHNFVRTMLRLGAERPSLRVVDDQRGAPTSARELARHLVRISEALMNPAAPHGTYHVTDMGETSWFGLASAVFELAAGRLEKRPALSPITSAEYPLPAPRPAWSLLDCGSADATFALERRPWRAALADVLDELLAAPPKEKT